MNDYAAHMIENCTISFCADISVAAHSKLGETAVSVGTLKLDVTVTCGAAHVRLVLFSQPICRSSEFIHSLNVIRILLAFAIGPL